MTINSITIIMATIASTTIIITVTSTGINTILDGTFQLHQFWLEQGLQQVQAGHNTLEQLRECTTVIDREGSVRVYG